MDYNRPFYFAVRRPATEVDMTRAVEHIRSTFGVQGPVEFVRAEPSFGLLRIV